MNYLIVWSMIFIDLNILLRNTVLTCVVIKKSKNLINCNFCFEMLLNYVKKKIEKVENFWNNERRH